MRTATWCVVASLAFGMSACKSAGHEEERDEDDERPAAAAEAAEAKAENGITWSFEDDAADQPPKGWTVAETNGKGTPASWRVEAMDHAPNGKQVLRITESRNAGSTYNVLLSEREFPSDLEVAVHIHAGSGKEDQGGGLVWRARDANNYYLTRWNPLEDNISLFRVEGGKRTRLGSLDVKADPSAWHEIEVVARGKHITVEMDGKVVLQADDETFTRGGRIGLWTKADAASSFDLLGVEWIGPKAK